MLNPYVQVLRTYDRGSLFYFGIVISTILWVIILISLTSASASLMKLIVAWLWWIGMVSAGILFHLKGQLARPQARLIPNYRQVHLTVAGVLLLSLALIPLAWSSGGTYFRLLMLMVAMEALLAWWVLLQTWGATVVLMAAYFALLAPPMLRVLQPFMDAGVSPLAWVLLLLALLGEGAALWRFGRLTEEDAAYHSGLHGRGRVSGTSAEAGEHAARTSGQIPRLGGFDPTARQLDRLRQRTWWRRILRWNVPSPAPRVARRVWIQILLGAGLLALMPHGRRMDLSVILLVWATGIPVAVLYSAVRQRTGALGWELLRPVDRSTFFREGGLALGVWMGAAWAVCAALGGLAVIIFGGDAFTPGGVGASLGLSLATQVLLFGSLVWIARTGWVAMWFVVPAITVLPVAGVTLWTGAGGRAAGQFIALSIVGMIILGLALANDAYRRWLTEDLP